MLVLARCHSLTMKIGPKTPCRGRERSSGMVSQIVMHCPSAAGCRPRSTWRQRGRAQSAGRALRGGLRLPLGEALYYITVAYAQLERGILRERVRAGMERAKKEGKHVGRPRVTDRARVMREWPRIRARIEAGEMSRAEAARHLGVGKTTVVRMLGG